MSTVARSRHGATAVLATALVPVSTLAAFSAPKAAHAARLEQITNVGSGAISR